MRALWQRGRDIWIDEMLTNSVFGNLMVEVAECSSCGLE